MHMGFMDRGLTVLDFILFLVTGALLELKRISGILLSGYKSTSSVYHSIPA